MHVTIFVSSTSTQFCFPSYSFLCVYMSCLHVVRSEIFITLLLGHLSVKIDVGIIRITSKHLLIRCNIFFWNLWSQIFGICFHCLKFFLNLDFFSQQELPFFGANMRKTLFGIVWKIKKVPFVPKLKNHIYYKCWWWSFLARE